MIDVTAALAKLRAPFPDNQISKLPKESKAQADQRKADRSSGVNCRVCGGWHHKNAVHLDYVGHAALTDRLLDADPQWDWQPMAVTDGLPLLDRNGGMWIRLTVAGVTRLGYGSADGKTGGDAIKEIIGDALRNAAMRFGAALDLWHKGDLHVEDDQAAPRHDPTPREQVPAVIGNDDRDVLMTMLEKSGSDVRAFCQHFGIASLPDLPAERLSEATALLDRKLRKQAGASQRQAPAGDILDDEVPY